MNVAQRNFDTLFAQAIEIASFEERTLFLEKACGTDQELRREVEKLVRDHFRAGEFLERPVAHVVATHDEPQAESPGTVMGPYKLLEQIGEGGFGVVFMAEQSQPVRRKVALKILKPGMGTRQVIARFEAERQALALMDHPNIAHVFDGGETASGRPYFVMELVRGIPIADFCDENDLPVRQRLELFVTVCQAIQHAHHKGIIHRDIKPSNILVTLHDGTPVVKVIDFGVAKALDQQLTEKSLFTNFAQMIGTPLYMSPEQAELSGRDVDTRTDIYALGVVLYELLTGTTPFDRERLRTVGYDEIRRIMREEDPPRPSTRVSTLGQAATTVFTRRRSDPKRLSRLYQGDLDWIVMKALEKDRDRRYETASALAADVQRYLADEPVLASPPSLRYRLGKFLRKHRGPVLAANVILVLLVGGIISTSLGFLRSERLRQIAEENEQTAQQEKSNALASAVAERLAQQNEAAERKKAEAAQRQAMEALQATSDDVIEQVIGAKPALGPADKAFLENTLKRWQTFAAEKGDGELARQVRAEGVFRVAYLRARLGEHDAALAGFREASDAWGKLADEFPAVRQHRRQLAASHISLGNLLRDLGNLAEAEAAYQQALGIQEKVATDFPAEPNYRLQLAAIHNNRGVVFRDLGELAKAEESHGRALTIEAKLGTESPEVHQYRSGLALTHNNLGLVFRDLGQRVKAEDAYRKALSIQEKLATEFSALPQYRLDLARILNDLAILLRDDPGRRTEAEAVQRQALGIQEKLAAEFPAWPQYRSELALSHNNLGNLLLDLRKPDKADTAYRQALVIQEKLAADFPTVPRFRQNLALSHNNRAKALIYLDKPAEAESAYRQALEIREQLAADFATVPHYRLQLSRSHNSLGLLYAGLRKWDEAETAYRQALTIQAMLADDFPYLQQYRIELGGTQVNFGRLLAKKRQPEPALEWYAKAIDNLEGGLRQVKVDASARRFLRNARWARAEALDFDLKRYAEALVDWDRTVELSPEPEQPQLRLRRAACRVRAGQVDAAIRETEEVTKNANAVMLFNAACVFALAAARPNETGSSSAKEACAKRAVALLRQAVAKDGKIAEHIRRDDDLQALRKRDDFKQLLAELKKKAP